MGWHTTHIQIRNEFRLGATHWFGWVERVFCLPNADDNTFSVRSMSNLMPFASTRPNFEQIFRKFQVCTEQWVKQMALASNAYIAIGLVCPWQCVHICIYHLNWFVICAGCRLIFWYRYGFWWMRDIVSIANAKPPPPSLHRNTHISQHRGNKIFKWIRIEIMLESGMCAAGGECLLSNALSVCLRSGCTAWFAPSNIQTAWTIAERNPPCEFCVLWRAVCEGMIIAMCADDGWYESPVFQTNPSHMNIYIMTLKPGIHVKSNDCCRCFLSVKEIFWSGFWIMFAYTKRQHTFIVHVCIT